MSLTQNNETKNTNREAGNGGGSNGRSTGAAKQRPWGKIGIGAALAVIVLGVAVWYFLIRENAPADVNSAEAAAARADAIAESADSPAADAPAAGAGIDGVWTVNTSIGEFNDGCLTEVCSSSFVGFRIDEVLTGIGDKTVVGRTPGVEGTVEISGTSITSTDITVDMTGLITDSGARNSAIRNQAIETSAFPTATFSLTEAIDLGSVPGDGEQVSVNATGDLTVHGVTRSVTIPLTAELQSGVVVIFGQLELSLPDYDIDAPSAPVVASVEDTAILELQLFLTQ